MKCLICNSNNTYKLKGYQKDYLSKCLNCSLVFSNKQPTKEDLDEVYSAYNYEIKKPTALTLKKIKLISKKLFYLNNPSNVLDLGCGDALFLDNFKKLGCKTFATEYNSRLCEIAKNKGHLIVDKGLYPKFANGEKMDLIIFTEVIEHITDHRKCLPHFHEILSDKGIIYITTPNFSSLERRIFKEKWKFLCYPEHLCYFNPKTLDICMNKFGFKKVFNYSENFSISAFLDFFRNRKSFSNSSLNENYYQKIAAENKLLKLLKFQINFFLRTTNLGTKIVAAYKKDY